MWWGTQDNENRRVYCSLYIPISYSGFFTLFLSIEWNSIRLGGPANGIVTTTVHKSLPGVVGAQGMGGYRVTGGGRDPEGGSLFDVKLPLSV